MRGNSIYNGDSKPYGPGFHVPIEISEVRVTFWDLI